MISDTDPVEVVSLALAAMPSDPAAANVDDLETIAAVQQGLTRHAIEVRRRLQALAETVFDHNYDINAALSERTDVLSQLARVDAADELLTHYARAAIAARGLDLDALVEAI